MAIEESTFFRTVPELAAGLRDGSFTSVELTQAYLDRAEELDVPPFELPSEPREDHQGKLATMVTIARDHALEAAERADRELAAGNPHSMLHGIPYGVKDLLDSRGIRTTWGSGIFRERVPDRNAAVIDRLEEAGAVLMAKNSLGEFAGGNTSSALNPWKLDRTSFGSSSGTVSAAVAGLIGFGIGTETGGSIVFPASAVGASGLRPTFGRVSRFGCMALSWSLDKIGPVGRSAEDCGHILEVIAGRDPRDTSTADRPFVFRADPGSMRGKRLGVHRDEFLLSQSETTRRAFQEALDVFAGMGVEVEDIELPLFPTGALFTTIVTVESGTNFKSLFDDGRAAQMFSFNEDRRAGWMAGRMLPAADYLTAQRIRNQLVREADEILSRYDAVIAPTWPNGAALRVVRDGWPVPARNEWEPPDEESRRTPAPQLHRESGRPPRPRHPLRFRRGRTAAVAPNRRLTHGRSGGARLRNGLPAGDRLAPGAASVPLAGIGTRMTSRKDGLSRRELLAGAAIFTLACSARSAGQPEYDLLLKGGHLIDPRNGLSTVRDVAVHDGKVAAVAEAIDPGRAFKVVECQGLYVTPGLIDLHVHVFAGTNERGSYAGDNSLYPDGYTFRSGVTTVVDAGCAGWRNFETFRDTVISRSRTRILALANIVGHGMRGGDHRAGPRRYGSGADRRPRQGAFRHHCRSEDRPLRGTGVGSSRGSGSRWRDRRDPGHGGFRVQSSGASDRDAAG